MWNFFVCLAFGVFTEIKKNSPAEVAGLLELDTFDFFIYFFVLYYSFI
jgi:hypothetical protein